MPKVNFVYLIASHNNSEQLTRLVKTISKGSPKSLILIHHDYSGSYLEPATFKDLENVRLIEDYLPVKWGEFSQVAMELHCINWLFKHDYKFDWLVFLSGQDYPICALDKIEKFYQESQYDGFMDYFLADKPREKPTIGGLGWKSTNTGRRRYFYRYYKLASGKNTEFLNGWVNRFFNRRQSLIKLVFNRSGIYLGIRRFVPIFNSKFKCYAGSNWHTLSYRCVRYLLDFIEQNPEFVNYYQKTLNSDESFFQSILLNQTELKIFNDNKRYIVWDGRNPYVWQSQDFDTLVNSERHFARKFNCHVDAEIVERLDRYFLQDRQQVIN